MPPATGEEDAAAFGDAALQSIRSERLNPTSGRANNGRTAAGAQPLKRFKLNCRVATGGWPSVSRAVTGAATFRSKPPRLRGGVRGGYRVQFRLQFY